MLKFATFTSYIELPFYTSLALHKIDYDKLDDTARQVLGLYEIRPNDPPEASCRLQIHGTALTNDDTPSGYLRAEGSIRNVNTVEAYRSLDKTAILSEAGRKVWDAILDGSVLDRPSLLASFSVICFADLKKYKFTYLFAFPGLNSDPPWSLHDIEGDEGVARLRDVDSQSLVNAVQVWRDKVSSEQQGFFLAKKVSVGIGGDSSWVIGSLADYENGFFADVPPQERFICFADPSTYPAFPGWMLRNLLILINQRWKLHEVQILCYRDIPSRPTDAKSIILRIEQATAPSTQTQTPDMPKVTGWERNNAGKVVNRIANLGDHMDPYKLADQAVDLNLKLMKWRIAPNLDLDKIKGTRCLLLGAGTLGSYVARNLMGWGVKKITFVDNGTVSYSNPVRQPLYSFEDCVGGSTKKAVRAAEALNLIYPGVDTTGYHMSVPMAGHAVVDEAAEKAEYETLKQLVDEHDVICQLMDSRESRWLPTVMGKATGKIVLNAALGFDTFVVMRHGIANPQDRNMELGCYFCNDVVAPADSLADRTLDQQCTVTRPGGAAIASALLVELLVSVLQHPQGGSAPAAVRPEDREDDHALGIVPHQIRGFLSNFQNMLIKGRSYDCCSACSERVVDAYNEHGWEFVKRARNERGFVEELSGLAEVQRAAERAMANLEISEEETGDDDEGEGELI